MKGEWWGSKIPKNLQTSQMEASPHGKIVASVKLLPHFKEGIKFLKPGDHASA